METRDEATSPAADMRLGPIGQFAVKTVIITAAIVVSAWIMLDILDDFADRRMQQFERSLRSATSLGGRQFWTKLENQLDQLADPRTSRPKRKRRSWRRSRWSQTGGGRSCSKRPRPSREMRPSRKNEADRLRLSRNPIRLQ